MEISAHAVLRYCARFRIPNEAPLKTVEKGILRIVNNGVKIGERNGAEYFYYKAKIAVLVNQVIVTVHKPDEPHMWAMIRDTLNRKNPHTASNL